MKEKIGTSSIVINLTASNQNLSQLSTCCITSSRSKDHKIGNNKLHVDLMTNDDVEIFFVCLFMHTAGLPTPTNHELVY